MCTKINYKIVLVSAVFIVFSCVKTKDLKNEQPLTKAISNYNEPYRPQFHFSLLEKWMNYPNGLVYYKGVYHLLEISSSKQTNLKQFNLNKIKSIWQWKNKYVFGLLQ